MVDRQDKRNRHPQQDGEAPQPGSQPRISRGEQQGEANPDLKVVLRELPIIAPASDPAARMALAAAAQGKFAAYHAAMFAGARPDDSSIAAAARQAGLDLPAAQAFAKRADVQTEIEHNLAYARELGISGTPAFAIGGQIIPGAVGKDKLQEAVDAARKG